MMPQMLTAVAVTSVQATIMMALSASTLTPSARASSSPRERTLMRQRTAKSAAIPAAIGGTVDTASPVDTADRLPMSQKTMAGSF